MRAHLACAFALVLLPGIATGQLPAKNAAIDKFPDEALVFERSETIFRMHADGTGEREVHVAVRLRSEGAVRQFGVLSFGYAAATENPAILLVRVHKADGTAVDTAAGEAIDMPAAVSREAPLYSDLKEKHLPVRSLSVGDTLEYQFRTSIEKPEAPGQFWGTQHFSAPGTVIVLNEALTLEVPKEKYVQVWSPNHKPTITEQAGVRIYHWQVEQLVPSGKPGAKPEDSAPAPRDPDEDSDGHTLPSVAWTTFHSWAEVGAWYRALAHDRAQPDEALRTRAQDITRNAKTPEQQVRALYAFVSSRVRYVGIDFGVGRYQPHRAMEVLANQYGDCKDKDTLLQGLLQSIGFQTYPALIGVGTTPVVEVPSPASFNHVVTRVDLAEGSIWLDSTPEVAPFRYLSTALRDQWALIIPANGDARLERTPAMPPYPLIAEFESSGALDSDGKFTSQITARYRTDDELVLRALGRAYFPGELDKVSQYVSSATGFSGTTSNTRIENLDDQTLPIVLRYEYTRQPYGDWDKLRIIPALPALEFTPLASEKVAPGEDIQLGAPRTLKAVSTIRLPEGFRTDLPDPVHVKTDFATFDKTYRFDGKAITVERTITVLKEKLAKEDWKQYQTFSKNISLSLENWMQLIKPWSNGWSSGASPLVKPQVQSQQKPAAGLVIKVAPPPGAPPNDTQAHSSSAEADGGQSAAEQLYLAFQRVAARDWPGAMQILDAVKARHPDAQGLWSGYGAIAMAQKHYSEAESNFRRELTAHPDSSYAANALAEAQDLTGNYSGAVRGLQEFLDLHPGELFTLRRIALLQDRHKDFASAAETLEKASAAHPDDRALRLQLGDALVKAGHRDEAAAVAKSLVETNDDPAQLNGAAYILAETGIDLVEGERIARRSVEILAAKSATITTAEVNSRAFADANTLMAAWDTLGWILFREGKTEESEALITAGWLNTLDAEAGYHMGQLLERQGKKQQALANYRMAAAAAHDRQLSDQVMDEIHSGISRLGGADGHRDEGTQEMQNLRTYKIPRKEGLSGWGTFRLQINSAGKAFAVQRMNGDGKLEDVAGEIGAVRFAELVPLGSPAHLLRSAVVNCSMGTTCELVLVPNSNLQTEQP